MTAKEIEKSVETILSPKRNSRQLKHQYLHIGFTLDGEDGKVMRQTFEKLGISSVAGYVRELVLADLKKRLSSTPQS